MDILVNISPIILLFSAIIYNVIDKVKLQDVILFIIYVFIYAVFVGTIWGYGNIVISIIMQIIFIFICIVFIIDGIECINCVEDLLLSVADIIWMLANIFFVFYRLSEEKIINIKLLEKVSIDLIMDVINNEWFKGIAIAASGTVLGGLILKKINKD